MANWKGFEQLAEQIARDVSPQATVTWNDYIYGHLTEKKRQIDVSIRWSEEDHNYLTIVQAKDWSTPADINTVGEFAGVVEDVRATRGILVCRSGFTEGAKTYARNKGISLYNLYDAQSRDWNLDLTIPLLWIDPQPQLDFNSTVHLDAGDSVPLFDGVPALSTDPAGNNLIQLDRTFEQLWNTDSIPQTIGRLHTVTLSEPVFMLVQDTSGTRQWRQASVEPVYEVDCRAWLGQFTPTECRGIIDHLDADSFILTHLPAGQIPDKRDERWIEIDDPNGVALNIRGAKVASIGHQMVPGALEFSGLEVHPPDPNEPGQPSP
jgi:Restriction endonuclease